jgi:hypothetical protein
MSEPVSTSSYNNLGKDAAEFLGAIADGNGIRAEQVRLQKQELEVYKIPAVVVTELKPKITEGQQKGKNSFGLVLGSKAEVLGRMDGLQAEFLSAPAVQHDVIMQIERIAGLGWGMEPLKIPLKETRKDFSVVDKCLKCAGAMKVNCVTCHAMGQMPCQPCHGQGVIPCQNCHGSGRVQQQDGSQAQCFRCNGQGRIVCTYCNNAKTVGCTMCNSNGFIGCTECNQSGFWTHTFSVIFEAEIYFKMDKSIVPLPAREIIEILGEGKLGTEGHAEITRGTSEIHGKYFLVPLMAALPVAAVEFSVEGKAYPATVAGRNARILKLEPFLDALIKPGINALFKLTKGPMAVESLIDMACKYKILKQVLSGLRQQSKRVVYQKVTREYSAILSDKYAKASIKYADMALLSLGNQPRNRGLLLGTLLSLALFLGYYLSPVRGAVIGFMAQKHLARYIFGVDMAVWGIGYLIALYIIKGMAAGFLKKIFPTHLETGAKKLPAAGVQGDYAIATTLAVFLLAASTTMLKPEVLAALLKKFGL